MTQAPAADQIFAQAIKLKVPIPEALYNGPRLHPWLQVFYNAFLDLIADRAWEWGMIPWTARQHWAEVNGLDPEATRLLHVHVSAMDVAFQKYRESKIPKQDGTKRPRPALKTRP